MTTTVQLEWQEPHPAAYGAPAGADHMLWTIATHELAGRVYCRETVECNGVRVRTCDYPANTPYADKRIAAIRAGRVAR